MTTYPLASPDDQRKAALSNGYTIDVSLIPNIPSTYRHSCGGEPVATYTKTSGGFTCLYATCSCGVLYLMDSWRQVDA